MSRLIRIHYIAVAASIGTFVILTIVAVAGNREWIRRDVGGWLIIALAPFFAISVIGARTLGNIRLLGGDRPGDRSLAIRRGIWVTVIGLILALIGVGVIFALRPK